MCEAGEGKKRKPSTNKGDYESVEKYVTEEIIRQNRAVSMTVLDELYGLEIGDSRYRHILKKWLQEKFPEQLIFFALKSNKAEVVINISAVNAQHVSAD